VSDVVESRHTIVEHLTKTNTAKLNESAQVAESYTKQDEEVRLLAYKLMIDKFNEKYADLSARQKAILKEYINDVSNTTTLRDYVIKESKLLQKDIVKNTSKVKDPVVSIKLKEVHNMLGKLEKVKTIKENHIQSLLLYHELVKELKSV
jgi:hypothetical protein